MAANQQQASLGNLLKNFVSNGMIGASRVGGVAPMQIDPNSGQFVQQQGHPFLSFLNAARPAIDFATGVYSAHAGGQDRGLAFAGLGNMLNNMGQRNYLNQMQQQAMREYKNQQDRQNMTDANNASIWNSRTGQNIQGPFDTTFADHSAGDIRDTNAVPSLNAMLGGEALKLDPYGSYDPALLKDYLQRQGDATNYVNANTEDITAGQKASSIGAPVTSPQAPAGSEWNRVYVKPGFQEGTLDNGTGEASLGPATQQALQAATAYSAPANQIPPNVSPYFLPTDVPQQVAGNQRAGLQDKQEAGKQTETHRSNIAGEQLKREQQKALAAYQAAQGKAAMINANAHMLQAQKYQPGGGGSNPNEAMMALQAMRQGLITPNEYKQTLGVKMAGQDISVPTKDQSAMMDTLKSQATGSKGGLFGFGASLPNIQALQQYNAYAPKLGYPVLSAPSASSMVTKQQGAGAQGKAAIRGVGLYGLKY